MSSLTSLILVMFVCDASNAQDDCRRTIVGEAGDCCIKMVCCGAATHPSCPQAIISVAGDQDEKKIVLRSLAQAPKEPKVWVGVRVAPVPEALVSHLKRDGVMIANVAEDSPADRAGVERYDVVVSFAGNAIEDMDDLLEAIRDTGPDNTAEMVVIRGGKEKTLTITPTKGGDPSAWVMKYEEPEEPEVDQLKKYFGGRLKVGPGDVRIYMPYGRLERLPDDIQKLLEEMPNVDWQEWSKNWEKWGEKWEQWAKKWEKFDQPFDIQIDIDSDDWLAGEEDVDVKAEIRVRLEEDGETITIERAKDGAITVERENAEGNRSSETYEDVDQLREEDPEAYKTFRRFLVFHSPRAFVISPDLKDLGVGQHEFQIELKQQLDRARQQLDRAAKKIRTARKRVEIRKKEIAGEQRDVEEPAESVIILVEDGHITLEITEDGVSKKYEFDSREDFKNSEPELYERFKKHLDAAGARSDESELTFARRIA
jgi:hypothetical protein